MSETIKRKARVYSIETLQPTSIDVTVEVPDRPESLAAAMEAVGGNEEKIVDAVHKLMIAEAASAAKAAAVEEKKATDPSIVANITPVRLMIKALTASDTYTGDKEEQKEQKKKAKKAAFALLRSSETIWKSLQDQCKKESASDDEEEDEDDE